ncbi:carboxylesterase family protein [Streptomyces sp. NPDC004237]|uniref:carboxylesterase/lipase family protein n=1 Tax=Streptomyces sp. NPDC004237 TaxID=3154455 RepID=UPI0033BDFFD4
MAHTANGAVRGLVKGEVDEFLGVPYAAPPVGALRWQPPRSAARWPGVRDATRFAPDCAQSAGIFGQASTSEDCLYLNVYTPSHQQAGAHSPVMVWIHGGQLTGGAGSFYDPTALVADGVTVVTVNYRLGALGFLAHQALADAHGQSGDYGLMDQQAALRWVQRNIAGFGGNPHNVTVFGQSAGGVSALAQAASPQAKGLFQRVIAQSGTYSLTQPTLAAAEASGKTFADKVGCADQTAACLRNVPVSTLLANQTDGYYLPNINSEVLPQSLGTAFATGHFNRVPVINGTNHDEWRLSVAAGELAGYPVTADNYQPMISSTLGISAAQAEAVATEYPLTAYPSPALALSAVGTDAKFACTALTLDRSASRFVRTYAYEFNDQSAPENFLPPAGFPYGAAHGSELQYLMGLPHAAFPGTLSAQQQYLAAVMKTYWTNFAKHGVPAASGTSSWPHFSGHAQKMRSLVPSVSHTESDFAHTHNCGFWTALQGG